MQRGPLLEEFRKLFRVHGGDFPGIERFAEASGEFRRSPECSFQGDLLVEHHADEESQRILGEEGVGLLVAGQTDG